MLTPFLAFLIVFLFLLFNNVRSDSVSFNFSNFGSGTEFSVAYVGDAIPLNGVIQLTNPLGGEDSVGRALYIPPVRLWDKATGKLASFQTEFSFVVNSLGSEFKADGLSFFMIPFDAALVPPKNSFGGFLGLFSPEEAFNQNQIVAVEFDSFGNQWDPHPVPNAPHIGIDINTIESVKTVDWPIDSVPARSIGKAVVTYDSNAKVLGALVVYNNVKPVLIAGVSHNIDLSTVLPESVRIGFSAATGNYVETHEILSWSFNSRI